MPKESSLEVDCLEVSGRRIHVTKIRREDGKPIYMQTSPHINDISKIREHYKGTEWEDVTIYVPEAVYDPDFASVMHGHGF